MLTKHMCVHYMRLIWPKASTVFGVNMWTCTVFNDSHNLYHAYIHMYIFHHNMFTILHVAVQMSIQWMNYYCALHVCIYVWIIYTLLCIMRTYLVICDTTSATMESDPATSCHLITNGGSERIRVKLDPFPVTPEF